MQKLESHCGGNHLIWCRKSEEVADGRRKARVAGFQDPVANGLGIATSTSLRLNGRITAEPFLRPSLTRRTLVASRQEAADHETKQKIPR
jgi:hypothetical protein